MMLLDGTDITGDEGQAFTDAEKIFKQDSLLCYRWVNLGDKGQAGESWSYRFYKHGNVSYSQLSPKKDWAQQGIWELAGSDDLDAVITTCEGWVQRGERGEVFPSTESQLDERNAASPLDSLVVFETPIERDEEMQRVMLAAFIRREMQIARDLVQLRETPEDGFEEQLNLLFPRQLISCRKPTRCEFDGKLCNTAKEARQPLFRELPEGGIWQRREGHHAAEIAALDAARGSK